MQSQFPHHVDIISQKSFLHMIRWVASTRSITEGYVQIKVIIITEALHRSNW